MTKFPRYVAILAGALFLGSGLYAFAAPADFFDTLATFPPYNEHFVHDLGAFQIAIGSMLILVATVKDGLYGVLAGATIGQFVHLASHITDRNLGENQSTTIPFLALLGGLMLVATLIRARDRT